MSQDLETLIATNEHIDITALVSRPPWHLKAACRGQPLQLFFPERGEPTQPAKDICATCNVIDQCETAGARERFGIWAGTSARQRRIGSRRRLDRGIA